MVAHTGAKTRLGAVRALNQPLSVAVKADDEGTLIALRLSRSWAAVESVADMWRLDDEWWREHPVSRMYYECVVDQGLKVTVFRDLTCGQWYCQR